MNFHFKIPDECLPIGNDGDHTITGYRLGKSSFKDMQLNFLPQLFDSASNHRLDVTDNPCDNCGTSLFSSIDLARIVGRKMKNKDIIIEIKLDPALHGPIVDETDPGGTPFSHFTWYQINGVNLTDLVTNTFSKIPASGHESCKL